MATNEHGCVRNLHSTKLQCLCTRAVTRATMKAEPNRRLARPHGEAGSSSERVSESWFGLSWSPMARCVGASLLRWPGKPSPCLLLSLPLRSSNCGATPNVSRAPFPYRTAKRLIAWLSSMGSETGRCSPSTHPGHPRPDQSHRGQQRHHHLPALQLQTLVAGTTCMVTRWKMTRRAITAHSATSSSRLSTSPPTGGTLESASSKDWSDGTSAMVIRR